MSFGEPQPVPPPKWLGIYGGVRESWMRFLAQQHLLPWLCHLPPPPPGLFFFPPQEVSRDFIPKGGFCSPERISGLLQLQAVRDGDRGAAAAPGAKACGALGTLPPLFFNIFPLFQILKNTSLIFFPPPCQAHFSALPMNINQGEQSAASSASREGAHKSAVMNGEPSPAAPSCKWEGEERHTQKN